MALWLDLQLLRLRDSDKGKEVTAETRYFLAELLKYFVATPETERDRETEIRGKRSLLACDDN